MKKNNKGFSLVELIIVIAIMAILAGAIAPALIRYIDKSRKSNDVTAAKSIKTAVETVMTNEDIYEALTTHTGATINDIDGNSITYAGSVEVAPATVTNGNGTGITLNATFAAGAVTTAADAKTEIGKNIGEKTPKISYKKAADGSCTPSTYYALISNGGTVVVGLGSAISTGNFYQLAPQVSKYYQ